LFTIIIYGFEGIEEMYLWKNTSTTWHADVFQPNILKLRKPSETRAVSAAVKVW
jgi:hypothetical protein